VSTQAAATAAAEDVEQLEAAYQQAFTAIETLVAAIERVHQLRGQQRAWEQATKLGVAGKRPEPWHEQHNVSALVKAGCQARAFNSRRR